MHTVTITYLFWFDENHKCTLLKIQRKIRTSVRNRRSERKNEDEPELITDIRNRDQGFVLFCFCFFACLFFFKSNIRNFLFRYISIAFFSWKCPVSSRFRSCMTWCHNNRFSTLLTIEPPVVRASALELWGWLVRFSPRDWNFSELTGVRFLFLPNRFFNNMRSVQ